MKRVSVFGATGSIGVNTLDLLARNRAGYDVVALTGGRNIELLARQAREFDAQLAVTCYAELLDDLRAALAGSAVEVAAGPAAIAEAAARPADWRMISTDSSSG